MTPQLSESLKLSESSTHNPQQTPKKFATFKKVVISLDGNKVIQDCFHLVFWGYTPVDESPLGFFLSSPYLTSNI